MSFCFFLVGWRGCNRHRFNIFVIWVRIRAIYLREGILDYYHNNWIYREVKVYMFQKLLLYGYNNVLCFRCRWFYVCVIREVSYWRNLLHIIKVIMATTEFIVRDSLAYWRIRCSTGIKLVITVNIDDFMSSQEFRTGGIPCLSRIFVIALIEADFIAQKGHIIWECVFLQV